MIKKMGAPSHYYALAFALSAFFGLAYLFQSPLLNNGDYQRITRDLISIPVYQELAHDCYAINADKNMVPKSLASGIFEINLILAKILGQSCWSLDHYFLMLAAIYLLGFFLCLRARLGLYVIAYLVIAPLLFSSLFKSLYEEGIVLALLPWAILGTQRLRINGKIWLFSISCGLIILGKPQLIIFAPAMLFAALVFGLKSKISNLKIVLIVAVLTLAIAGSLYQKYLQQDNVVNAYNRLFNGIGWSMQAVHVWPASDFGSRLEYFSHHQVQLQQLTEHLELQPNFQLWGTSFWPTGLELLTSGNDAQWQKVEQYLNLKFFLQFLVKHPMILVSYLQNALLVFLESNYSFGALQPTELSKIGKIIASISYFGLQHIIFLYCLLFAYCLLSRQGISQLLIIMLLALPPFAVILGDGFFEFEKHLMPFWVSLPLLLIWIPPSTRSTS